MQVICELYIMVTSPSGIRGLYVVSARLAAPQHRPENGGEDRNFLPLILVGPELN
jgi:hypothetical protein